jgi:LacI family transcriptional regulator
VRQIAETLGVSIGTVDRALHDRAGISPDTRARVLAMAKTLGYKPNLAARFLASERRLRIAVNFPKQLASFWDLVREGLRDAFRPYEASGIQIVPRWYPALGDGEREALEEALADEVNGIILVPGLPERLEDLVAQAAERDIPLVYVNTDAPGTKRLTVVCAEPLTSGALAGELLGRFLGGEGRVMPVTGHLRTEDHARKVEGFSRSMATLWPGIEVAPLVEGHEDEAEAYEKCRSALAADPRIAGLYVCTANTPPVIRALSDEGRLGRVTVIATDLYPALASYIKSGAVAATMDQRPWMQGQVAFRTLLHYLVDDMVPPPVVGLSPHVVMKSNLGLLLERLRSTAENGRFALETVEGSSRTPF